MAEESIASNGEFHEILFGLTLHPCLEITVTPVTTHPSDVLASA